MAKVTAERIAERRKLLGLSQLELAHKIGQKNKSSISHWETGNREPEMSNIIELAATLDCTPDYLTGRTQSPDAVLVELTADEFSFVEWLRSRSSKPSTKEADDFLIGQHTPKKRRPRSER